VVCVCVLVYIGVCVCVKEGRAGGGDVRVTESGVLSAKECCDVLSWK